jgi:hypothetical protein
MIFSISHRIDKNDGFAGSVAYSVHAPGNCTRVLGLGISGFGCRDLNPRVTLAPRGREFWGEYCVFYYHCRRMADCRRRNHCTVFPTFL